MLNDFQPFKDTSICANSFSQTCNFVFCNAPLHKDGAVGMISPVKTRVCPSLHQLKLNWHPYEQYHGRTLRKEVAMKLRLALDRKQAQRLTVRENWDCLPRLDYR